MDRRRNLMADVVSGGGMEMTDLPLLWEKTLTEPMDRLDTGQNAFKCRRRIVVDIYVPKYAQSPNNEQLGIGCHTETSIVDSQFRNNFLATSNCNINPQHGQHCVTDAFRLGDDSAWTVKSYSANLVNAVASAKYKVLSGYHIAEREAITGLVFGCASALNPVPMIAGTIIKVYGY